MDIFCSAVGAGAASGAQRCSRTPVCLLGLLTAGQTSHRSPARGDTVLSHLKPRNARTCLAFLLQREGVSACRGRLNQRGASARSGRASLCFRWFETQEENSEQPRRPPNKAKRASTHFAIANRGCCPRFFYRTEEPRRADIQRQREDRCGDPTEEQTKGELHVPPPSS